MKILVTGAAGFIGSALSKKLLTDGHHVLGLDNFSDYYDVQLKKDRVHSIQKLALDQDADFRFETLDLIEKSPLEKLYKEFAPEVVVNLAAQAGVRYSLENPYSYIDSNIVGFMNILECCRHLGCQHLVYASSSSVYGANTEIPFSVHHGTQHPVSLYAATKKSNEMMAHCYSHLYQIPATGLRFFTVYGPWGRPDMAMFKFTEKILKGDSIDVYNHGHHKRDFTYIDDIVEGVSRVCLMPAKGNPEWDGNNPDPASSKAPHRIYNIGNHQPILLSDFIETLEEVIGKKADKNYLDMQPGDVEDTFADVSELQKDFGYAPNTSLREGIQQFYNWYKDYYEIEQ